MKPYVVSEVPSNMISGNKKPMYYCHERNTLNVPVFGIIGDKTKANKVCKLMNRSVGA